MSRPAMTYTVTFLTLLPVTAVLMGMTVRAGLRKRRRAHVTGAVSTVLSLSATVVFAYLMSLHERVLPGREMGIHRVFSMTVACVVPAVVITGILLWREPRWRRAHQWCVGVLVLGTIGAFGTGIWVLLLSHVPSDLDPHFPPGLCCDGATDLRLQRRTRWVALLAATGISTISLRDWWEVRAGRPLGQAIPLQFPIPGGMGAGWDGAMRAHDHGWGRARRVFLRCVRGYSGPRRIDGDGCDAGNGRPVWHPRSSRRPSLTLERVAAAAASCATSVSVVSS